MKLSRRAWLGILGGLGVAYGLKSGFIPLPSTKSALAVLPENSPVSSVWAFTDQPELRHFIDEFLLDPNWTLVLPFNKSHLGIGSALETDWVASGVYEGLAQEGYNKDFDTAVFNSGGSLVGGGKLIVADGMVNYGARFYEFIENTSPIYFTTDGGLCYVRRDTGEKVACGTDPNRDFFAVTIFRDSKFNTVFEGKGLGWRGTYAASQYVKREIENGSLENNTHHWEIVEWTATHSDNYPRVEDNYRILAWG